MYYVEVSPQGAFPSLSGPSDLRVGHSPLSQLQVVRYVCTSTKHKLSAIRALPMDEVVQTVSYLKALNAVAQESPRLLAADDDCVVSHVTTKSPYQIVVLLVMIRELPMYIR